MMNRSMMRKAVWTSALIVALAVGAGVAHERTLAAENAPAPEFIAAAFHADWCPACKEMGPEFMKAKKALMDEDILFVKFDLTSEESKHQAALLASALGLDDLWNMQDGATGAVRVVNAETSELVDTLTREDDSEAMQQKLRAALEK
jgi:thiol-disulfide isomerase/thioredoxin